MSREIERKFLLSETPPQLRQTATRVLPIRQGYITPHRAAPQVRLRSKGEKFYLTVKGKGTLEREEVEIEMAQEQFVKLWPLTTGRRLRKTRYEMPYQGLIIEIDVFEDQLQGLLLAEVEFDSVSASRHFDPPEWMDREVTEDTRFTNSYLAATQEIPQPD
jgi:CYTH domain-containing protein